MVLNNTAIKGSGRPYERSLKNYSDAIEAKFTALDALTTAQTAENLLLRAALDGTMVLDISPATVTPVPTAEAWTRSVVLTLQNAAGATLTAYDGAHTTSAAIADTGGGTASIVSTTVTFVDGVCTIVVSGTEATWADSETDTLTISNLTILGQTVTGGTSVETFTTA